MARDNSRGRKWDGKSRVSNDQYRKNYNKIFRKIEDPFDIEVKEKKKLLSLPRLELKQDLIKAFTQPSLNKKYGDLVENIIQRKLKQNKDKKEK